jgi:TonB family protein
MLSIRRTIAVAAAAATWLALTSAITASEELNRAKDLYRSAAYDEALSLLDSLPSGAESSEALEAREYRVLCLVALDRRDDAKKAMAALIAAEPLYAMSETEAAPRVRTMFTEVRRATLPSVIQNTYADAKSMFDRKDPKAAAAFDRVLTLLKDPDVAGNAGLADLVTVASGFRDLSKALATTPPTSAANPLAAAAPPPAATPIVRTATPTAVPVLVPPVAIAQSIPVPQVREEREWDGEVEVTIDAAGKVTAARMTKSIQPVYDQQLIRAALGWSYKPALRDGAPTTYVKQITIHVDSRPECSVRITRACRPVTADTR